MLKVPHSISRGGFEVRTVDRRNAGAISLD
jgi:hypothetical protein